MSFVLKSCVFLLLAGLPISVSAQNIRIEVENLQSADGFFFTPLFAGFHDGGFDYFDANVSASASMSLESMAEGGDLAGLIADITTAGGQGFGILDPAGFGGAPVFDPGNSVRQLLNVSTANRFFSFGSMIIPSNDGFIGNDDAMEFEVFDAMGNFNGPIDILVFGSDLYDAGTEVNDGMGAAFSATGGMDTTEMLSVRSHPGLTNFLGTQTAAGTTIGSDILAGTSIARIRITSVPEPGSMSILIVGLAGTGLIRRRRKN